MTVFVTSATGMSEAEFAAMLIEYGMPAEDLELQVLCHFR